jgi:molybdate transport system substrate-binding protein
MDVLDLDPKIAKPQPLWLNLTTVAKNPGAARRFMEYAAGPDGQAIFRKHGFLDNKISHQP